MSESLEGAEYKSRIGNLMSGYEKRGERLVVSHVMPLKDVGS